MAELDPLRSRGSAEAQSEQVSSSSVRWGSSGSPTFVDDLDAAMRVRWASHLSPSELVPLLDPVLDDACRDSAPAVVWAAPSGYSERLTGCSQVRSFLAELVEHSASYDSVRLEMVVPRIGPVAVGLLREQEASGESGCAVELVAPNLRPNCLKRVYQESVPPDQAALYDHFQMDPASPASVPA